MKNIKIILPEGLEVGNIIASHGVFEIDLPIQQHNNNCSIYVSNFFQYDMSGFIAKILVTDADSIENYYIIDTEYIDIESQNLKCIESDNNLNSFIKLMQEKSKL